jgi:maltose alpha-D-glucosyltransferase/alpha-amylase
MNVFSSIDAKELTVTETADELWYKDAVIYQLHVKAFADSNNDGIGDFAGLTEKLPYLQDLGVTALWLLPFSLAGPRRPTSPTMATSIPISAR